ncbi:MAG: hypothetical protein U0168_32345 [Nannocystaceae bacterium]
MQLRAVIAQALAVIAHDHDQGVARILRLRGRRAARRTDRRGRPASGVDTSVRVPARRSSSAPSKPGACSVNKCSTRRTARLARDQLERVRYRGVDALAFVAADLVEAVEQRRDRGVLAGQEVAVRDRDRLQPGGSAAGPDRRRW